MSKQFTRKSRVDEDRRGLLHDQGNISSAPVGTLASRSASDKDAQGRVAPHHGWAAQLLSVPRRVWNSGLTCAFLASLIFSFSSLCVKLTGGRIPVLEVCFIRSSISFALTMVLMASTGMSPKFGQRKNRLLLCARGCCGACSMTSSYVGLLLLPLGDAVTLGLIGPSITATAARLFLKEPLGYRGVVGCLVSMGGVIVLSNPPFLSGGEHWEPNQALGVFATVLAAFLGAGSSMTIRLIGNKEPAAVIALWFHTCTMVLTFVPLALGVPARLRILAPEDFGLMMGVASTSFVAQLLSTRGLQMVVAAKAAAMGFTQVFYSYLCGMFFFNEQISSRGLSGVLLILIGVLLVTVRSSSSKAGVISAAAAARDHVAFVKEVLRQGTCAKDISFRLADGDKLADGEQEQLQSLAADALYEHNTQEPLDAAVLIRVLSKKALSGRLAETATEGSSGAEAVRQSAFVGGSLQQAIETAAKDEECVAALEFAEYLQQMAVVAAQAAAALGGELDPVAAASLAASRQASLGASMLPNSTFIGRARSAMGTPGMLSPTPSAFNAARSAVAAANHVVDIPASRGISRNISSKVSGWLAANLLANTPADASTDLQSAFGRVSDAAGTSGTSNSTADEPSMVSAGLRAASMSRPASRQPSSWLSGRLAVQQAADGQQEAERLSEAFLGPHEEPSSTDRQPRDKEDTILAPSSTAMTQKQVRFSGTDDVRAASELVRERSVERSCDGTSQCESTGTGGQSVA